MPTPGVLQAADPQPQAEIQTLQLVPAEPQTEPEPAPAPPALRSQSQQLIEEARGWPVPSIEQIIRDMDPPQTRIWLDYQVSNCYTPEAWDGTRYTADALSVPGLVQWQVTTTYNNQPYFYRSTNSTNSMLLSGCTYDPPQWTYAGTGTLTCTYPLHGSAYERAADRNFELGSGLIPPLREAELTALQASARQLGLRAAGAEALADEARVREDMQAAAARVRELREMRAGATAEVQRAWHAEQEQRQRQRQEAREVAQARARALLLEHLDEEQMASFEREDHFLVSVRSGRRYRIRAGWAGNVEELREDGVAIARYCIHPTDYDIPVPDSLLAQLLLLQADERTFRQVANRTRLAAADERAS